MSVTGSVLVDLRDVPRDRQRHRLSALDRAPDGARAVVVVGALAAEPEAIRVLREHEPRLRLDVRGEGDAVQRWLDALGFDPTLRAGGGTP